MIAGGLLVWNTATRPDARLEDLKASRRYWEDVTIAVSGYFYRKQPEVPAVNVGEGPAPDIRHHYRRYLLRMVEAERVQPWQFWRTVPLKPALKKERVVPRDFDDPGRPALLTFAFRLMDGPAPYLGLWLCTLLAFPVLVWMSRELWAAGWPVSGTILPATLACSAFVVDILTLPYSALGFYLLAALLLLCFACFATLAPRSSVPGLALRLALVGSGFALCVLGRIATMTMLPAFLVAAVVAFVRHGNPAFSTRPPRWRWAGVIAAVSIFLAPYVAVRQPRHHGVWAGLWEGLGDFDRKYDHAWSDPALRAALRREGMDLPRGIGVEFESHEVEVLIRRLVLDHVLGDPSWWADILARRTLATLTQAKLAPWTPVDGRHIQASSHRNEGRIDVYYKLATTVDFFRVGRTAFELPIWLMAAPAVVLVALWLGAPRRGRSPEQRARLRGALGVMLTLAMGTAALPILITTASAFEVQIFAFVYFAGFAFLTEQAWRLRRLPTASVDTGSPGDYGKTTGARVELQGARAVQARRSPR
jgi:hypothetical protein